MVNWVKTRQKKKKILGKHVRRRRRRASLYTGAAQALEREKVEEVDAKELADIIYSNDINQVNKIIDDKNISKSKKCT